MGEYLKFKNASRLQFDFAANAALLVAIVGVLFSVVGCSQFATENAREASADTTPVDSSELDDYIVVLAKPAMESFRAQAVASQGFEVSRQAVVTSAMKTLAVDYDLSVASKTFSHAIQGGVFELRRDEAEALQSDSRVAYIERDGRVSISSMMQATPPWGLDRLDQPTRVLDNSFTSPSSGASVTVYVIDTGVLVTHADFQGRATSGFDFVDQDSNATDCNGHGTHVAGTIAGATFGVAKNAKIIAVRVLDCEGSGTFSGLIQGIEWVTANRTGPSVANMSLGGGVSQAIDDAVNASIQSGVTYVVAAGNNNQNACNSSPARVPLAITVGATTKTDARSSFSNFGSCLDIFAPGSDITSSWFTSRTSTKTISGTSMAAPHVAGIAALYLAQNPTAWPSEVVSKITTNALAGRVQSAGTGSPNLLANSTFLFAATPSPGPTPAPIPTPPPNSLPIEPGVTRLQNGVSLEGISGSKGVEIFYAVTVPAGATRLSIEILGGTGDADIYVKKGVKPTATGYDCRPYRTGNTESCVVTAPTAGTYYIRVFAYKAYSGLRITARW